MQMKIISKNENISFFFSKSTCFWRNIFFSLISVELTYRDRVWMNNWIIPCPGESQTNPPRDKEEIMTWKPPENKWKCFFFKYVVSPHQISSYDNQESGCYNFHILATWIHPTPIKIMTKNNLNIAFSDL